MRNSPIKRIAARRYPDEGRSPQALAVVTQGDRLALGLDRSLEVAVITAPSWGGTGRLPPSSISSNSMAPLTGMSMAGTFLTQG